MRKTGQQQFEKSCICGLECCAVGGLVVAAVQLLKMCSRTSPAALGYFSCISTDCFACTQQGCQER